MRSTIVPYELLPEDLYMESLSIGPGLRGESSLKFSESVSGASRHRLLHLDVTLVPMWSDQRRWAGSGRSRDA